MISGCGYCIEEVLEIHHRDGNHRNNKMWNLMVTCPTHHKEFHAGIRKLDKPRRNNCTIKKDWRKNGNGTSTHFAG